MVILLSPSLTKYVRKLLYKYDKFVSCMIDDNVIILDSTKTDLQLRIIIHINAPMPRFLPSEVLFSCHLYHILSSIYLQNSLKTVGKSVNGQNKSNIAMN